MRSDSNDSVSPAIEQLRSYNQINIQDNWRYWQVDSPSPDVSTLLNCPVAQINAKGHIAWPSGRQVLWLAQKLVIPQNLQSYPLEGLSLRLVLTWWAEAAQVFVDGVGVQAGDLFDCSTRVQLSSSVKPGTEITIALRLVSPSHDQGALVQSRCIYEGETLSATFLHPGFVADELAVLQCYLTTLVPEKLPVLAATVAKIDWPVVADRQKFTQSLFAVRQHLRETLQPFPQPRRLLLLGHAHLDLAWLWPVSETWEAAQSTFESVLNLQKDFPELIFCHSTPALYAWIEQHRPDLFAAIQKQVAAGRWEIVGGLWVEPDLNLINGESIVRQVFYGQRYILEKFGKLCQVAWLPDSFGFPATLPQLLALGGIQYFVTQKLRWNDTTKFPYGAFWWQSPDGTQIFSLMSAPIGEGIDPIKMATYAVEWETQTGCQDALWLPGVGNHGGGPTRDMLEQQRRYSQSPFFPQLEFTTALDYLQCIKGKQESRGENYNSSDLHTIHFSPSPPPPLPTWPDELYLEFHRGCYTTHADQKRWNRRCEELLYQAELFASLATISAGVTYPKAELEAAWKKVLFNQFHDILPGSAIPQVYLDANQAWQEVEQVGSQLLQQSLSAIASQIMLPPPPQPKALPIIVFNPLNWERTEVVAVSLEGMEVTGGQRWRVYNADGSCLPSQMSEAATLLFLATDIGGSGESGVGSGGRCEAATLLFLATDIPSIGYRLFWLCSEDDEVQNESISVEDRHLEDSILENEFLRVIVDNQSGDLRSVFDKSQGREVLSELGGNHLQAFQDSGQYWDAWNIDPNYHQHPLPPTQLKAIHWIDQGAIQTRLRVIRTLGQSEFCQDYILQTGSRVLKIVTKVHWQEQHVLVKAAFPLNLEADYATYEIPCGSLARKTSCQNPIEQAKWEVPALRWADLTATQPGEDKVNSHYGVSLLNDCKYGYDTQPSQLCLTLLRSSTWPDPNADQGFQQFTYALYPHNGSWQSAHTVRRGYELNLPLQVMLCPNDTSSKGTLPAVGCLLNLQSENLILMAFKQSEDGPEQWILRCYECHGEPAELSLQSDLGLTLAYPVDLLEQSVNKYQPKSNEKLFKIEPWKIASFALKAY